MPFGSDMFINKAICGLVLYYDSLTSSSPLTLLLLCLIGQVHFEKVNGVTISNLGAEGSSAKALQDTGRIGLDGVVSGAL